MESTDLQTQDSFFPHKLLENTVWRAHMPVRFDSNSMAEESDFARYFVEAVGKMADRSVTTGELAGAH